MTVTRILKRLPDESPIELHHVSRRFMLYREKRRSLQELFIRLVRGQRKTADEFWPLRDISFTINPGDSIGILGPNGSGKSTLLKVITGILSPSGGDMIVRGRISSLLELGAGFNPDLTGRENIYLNGSIYGMSRTQMDERLDAIIDYADLREFIDTPIKHYSSGMYVRLGFAVAIHTEPDLLLVDEVLAVGDMRFQRKCLQTIQDFRDNNGTLVLVSHDLSTIQRICNRAIWLRDGYIAAEGSTLDVSMAYLEYLTEQEQAAAEKTEQTHGDAAYRGANPEREQRWGTGKIQMTNVEFCDETGALCQIFTRTATWILRIHYRAEEPIAHPVFGMAIHHSDGTLISGPNTKFSQMDIPLVHGEGIIEYCIPALTLLEGEYIVSVAVVNQADTETFDYHDRRYRFQVHRRTALDEYGLVSLGGTWSIEPKPVEPEGDSRVLHENHHVEAQEELVL